MKNNILNTKILIIISLTFIVVACNFSNKDIHEGAEKMNMQDVTEITLKGEEVIFDSILLKPTDIEISGSSIITRNAYTQHVFHIYDISDKRKVSEKITVGQGPDEMLFPLFSENSKEYISILEHSKQKIFTYSTADFLNDEAPKAIYETKLEKNVDYAHVLKDRRIIGSTSNDLNSQLAVFDKDGIVEKEFGKYPQAESNPNDLVKINAYRRSLAFNEEKDRIMLFYFFTDLIEIYDFEGHLIKSVQGADSFLPVFDANGASIKGQTRAGFWGKPVFDSEYCYILYSGVMYQDFNEEINSIYVFNWDGQLVQILNLNKSIFTFTKDPHSRTIYGLSNSPDVSLIKFDLPNL